MRSKSFRKEPSAMEFCSSGQKNGARHLVCLSAIIGTRNLILWQVRKLQLYFAELIISAISSLEHIKGELNALQVGEEGEDQCNELGFQETYGDINGYAWCNHERLLVFFQAGEPGHCVICNARPLET